jgi:Transposase IS4
MSLSRFKQMRGAFHPEEKAAGAGGDKCYMLRHLINICNASSMSSFYVPKDLAFDEGGVGCRSRYCPCRQYNKDKPQKFRVDFFVMSGARCYQILHIDIYQGKNGANIGIDKDLVDLPTTQKVVANAAYSLGLHKLADGARHVAMDRYQCPELAVFLRECCNLYSTGTCQTNREGWKEGGLNLKKTQARGTHSQAFDDQNRILLTQWVDSKVVNVVSTLCDTAMTTCRRQIGSIKKVFPCPVVVRKYQQDMGSIDHSDQIRMHGGGFSNKAHFKKWYKKVYLAIILDILMVNSYIAWNMSCAERGRNRGNRRTLK